MKKTKVWADKSTSLDPLIEKFTVGDDYKTDLILIPYDVKASLVHAQMLHKIGIITKDELDSAKKGLNEILNKWKEGKFKIAQSQEDGHTAIEQYLTENFGDIGKKIHTGRSRNDQALVTIRLFMKDSLVEIGSLIQRLTKQIDQTQAHIQDIPMPGYTHMQKAMPTTIGTWLGSFKDAISDTQICLDSALTIIDQNPLGSASGFGVENIKLDREFTTEKLDFKKTQQNPMYCGMSRGYFENLVLQSIAPFMIISGKIANDMLLFSTSEFGFISLPVEFTTGSSIMPQKRNYDLFEIMRGNTKVFLAYQEQIQDIVFSIGSGYQRDLQLTKKPFIKGISLCQDTLNVLISVFKNLQIHKDNLDKAMTSDLFATEEVYKLVNKGMSFRDAYMQVKNQIFK